MQNSHAFLKHVTRGTGILLLGVAFAVWGTNAVSKAQEQGLILSTEYVYGDRFAFRLESVNTSQLTRATLFVEETNIGLIYSGDQPIQAGSNSVLAVLAVETLKLGAFARLTYHWELNYADGGSESSTEESVLYEDTSVPWKWTVTRQGNIVAHSDGRDLELDSMTINAGTAAVERLQQLLGDIQVPAQIDIYVYPELATMASGLRLHHERVQDWVAAYTLPDQAVVVVAYGNSPDALTRLRTDIAHEISHILMYDSSSATAMAVPGWLNEGVALNIAGDNSFQVTLDQGVHRGVLLSLDALCAPRFSSLPPRDAALAYAQSASFEEYLLKRYGASQLRVLVDSYRQGASCDAGVTQAYGITLSDLESQWHAQLATSTNVSSDDSSQVLPWILAWLASIGIAILFVMPSSRRDRMIVENATQRNDLVSST